MDDRKVEVRAEIRRVTELMLHHRREAARLARELENLENALDGIYFREEQREAVSQ
jgi:hypothetical protein